MESTTESGFNNKRKIIAFILFSIIVTTGVIVIYTYMKYKETHITTDDAFVDGRIHKIASKVSGTIENVYVTDNEFVKEGSLIVALDESDYVVKVKEAESALKAENAKLSEIEASIEVARKQLSELHFMIASTKANLTLKEATDRQAKSDLKRAEQLFKKEIMPEEQLEKAKTAYDVAGASLAAAREQLRQSEASVETQKVIIKQMFSTLQSQKAKTQQKEESLRAAQLKRSYTRLYAPSDGYITKKSVETGDQIQAGQPLMTVVPLSNVWVTANYKETQLGGVKPGQKVSIKVDTFPGKVFQGTVQSIMAGTGSVFSLFPPENATGNYVKVVQRIPVKIVLDEGADPDHILRIGMSVVPTIIIEK